MAVSLACRAIVKLSKLPQLGLLALVHQPLINVEIQHRHKHYAPKWKRLRKEKVAKIDLPEPEVPFSELSKEQVRARLKQQGLLPPRPWMERTFYVSCTGGVFEGYVPPEGDGKMSIVSSTGAKQRYEFLEKKSKSMLAVRKIRSFDEEFSSKDFVDQAQDIYIKAHTFLAEKDNRAIREFITEKCYPEMIHNTKDRTIRWRFLNSLEPPYVVHARCTNIISKENVYAQVTVRFHTQQQLAVYDRFGRLIHGSEILAKDVLEYIVFEKHLANTYGTWRIHSKIIPDWMPPKEPSPVTYVDSDEPIDVGLSKSGKKKEAEQITAGQEATEIKPALATA